MQAQTLSSRKAHGIMWAGRTTFVPPGPSKTADKRLHSAVGVTTATIGTVLSSH